MLVIVVTPRLCSIYCKVEQILIVMIRYAHGIYYCIPLIIVSWIEQRGDNFDIYNSEHSCNCSKLSTGAAEVECE